MTVAAAAAVAEAVVEVTAVAASPQMFSPAPTAAAVGMPRQTPPSAVVGVEDGGGDGGHRDGHGGDDAEDGTCRTSSAYILLQLRDLGRKPSSPGAAMSKEAVAAPAATATASAAAATSPVMTAQQRLTSANGGAHQQQIHQQQHEQQKLIQRQQQQQQQLQRQHQQQHHHQQVQDERAGARPPGGVNSGGDGGVPYGMSPTNNAPATPGYGMTSALERGMYVAGQLPGFQGSTSPPAAAAPSQGSLLQQHQSQMPRGAVLPPGMGGSAALRPICPKRSPETVMVISPTTGQLVPVSVCV